MSKAVLCALTQVEISEPVSLIYKLLQLKQAMLQIPEFDK